MLILLLIKRKILFTFLLFNTLAIAFTGTIAYLMAQHSLEHTSFNTLISKREIKKRQVENYFNTLLQQLTVLSEGAYSPNEQLGLQKTFTSYMKIFAWNNIMILDCNHGDIVSNYQDTLNNRHTSIKNEPTIRLIFDRYCLKHDTKNMSHSFYFSDFQITKNNNLPVAYMAAPILEKNKVIAAYLVEISSTEINQIMTEKNNWAKEGGGLTSETYIVGSDFKMRSDSRFVVENVRGFVRDLLSEKIITTALGEEFVNKKSTIMRLPVTTAASLNALKGISNTEIIKDYRNKKVISSYTSIQIPDVNWAIISEVDYDEAFRSAFSLRKNLILIMLLSSLLFAIVGSVVAKRISIPIENLIKNIVDLQEKFQQQIGQNLHDELAQELLGISLFCTSIKNKLNKESHPEATNMARVTALLEQSTKTARDLSHGLCPIGTITNGVIFSLQQLAQTTEVAAQIKCSFQYTDNYTQSDASRALNIYRIAQEALANAIKHGHATEVRINLFKHDKQSILEILNNGEPFSYPNNFDSQTGIGLHLMELRAKSLNGVLSVNSENGWTKLTCIFKDNS